MVKRKIDSNPLWEKDKLTTFLCADDHLRAVLCHGSMMINEMKANHQLQIAETLILGQNYLAASLLSSNLKEEDVIRLKINCSGPLGGLNVEADFRHRVRGYLINNPIKQTEPGSMSMSDFFGAGILSFTRTNRLTNRPFTGQIELQYGNTASDLAYYFTASEQIATSFNLNISFNDSGNVTGAGGLLIQALPGADEKLLMRTEEIVKNLPSIGDWYSKGGVSSEFILKYLAPLNPRIISNTHTQFFCDCAKERIQVHISSLSEEDKEDIINKNDFPIKTLCHNCGTSYIFSREESMELIKNKKNIQ
ncbi:MAG: Hsp33 family molecular chaperone HslO [Spirochaetaceae bacterium]|jgi:molecular chaperone Hsp33|nr:Hsp33 family molecular chaperone HslO [Spirochaetaceae bacterium]